MADPQKIVRQGYDRIAEQYLSWSQGVRQAEREKYTRLLLESLPPGADLLELGCGAGEPTTRRLTARFRVTGLDISLQQLKLAQVHAAGAAFVQADIQDLPFSACTFDGVCAFYVFNHFPREHLPGLLAAVHWLLRPGGLFLASHGTSDEAAYHDPDWLGAPTFWSSHDPEKTLALVRAAGFSVRQHVIETDAEFDQPVDFLWIKAEKG